MKKRILKLLDAGSMGLAGEKADRIKNVLLRLRFYPTYGCEISRYCKSGPFSSSYLLFCTSVITPRVTAKAGKEETEVKGKKQRKKTNRKDGFAWFFLTFFVSFISSCYSISTHSLEYVCV